MTTLSLMRRETLESADVTARQLIANAAQLKEFGKHFRKSKAYSWITLARGSSDHAAGFFAYLAAIRLNMLNTSFSPSLITLHRARVSPAKSLLLAISQSGQGPDVGKCFGQLAGNALSNMAIVNNVASPLAKKAQWIFPMHAGDERAIPATKTTIASFCAAAALIDACLLEKSKNKMQRLPEELQFAQSLSWSSAVSRFKNFQSLIVISRGLGLTLAQETALKFKEACGISAEAFSSAEFKHGPQAIVAQGTPIFILAPEGKELKSILEMAKALKQLKGNVLLAAPSHVRERDVTMPKTSTHETGIICAAQNIYLMIEELARARGMDPDSPRHLLKITKTV